MNMVANMVVEILVTTLSVSIPAGFTSGELPQIAGSPWAMHLCCSIFFLFAPSLHATQPKTGFWGVHVNSHIFLDKLHFGLQCVTEHKKRVSLQRTHVHFRRRTAALLRDFLPPCSERAKPQTHRGKRANSAITAASFGLTSRQVDAGREKAAGGAAGGGCPIGVPPHKPRSGG